MQLDLRFYFVNKIVVNKQLSRPVNKENSHPLSDFATFGEPIARTNVKEYSQQGILFLLVNFETTENLIGDHLKGKHFG